MSEKKDDQQKKTSFFDYGVTTGTRLTIPPLPSVTVGSVVRNSSCVNGPGGSQKAARLLLRAGGKNIILVKKMNYSKKRKKKHLEKVQTSDERLRNSEMINHRKRKNKTTK